MYEANKSLGQNFLTDISVAQRMVENLNIAVGEEVIEVGPGLGVVTSVLEKLTYKLKFDLYAVEIDTRFITRLERMFAENQFIHIENEDILKFLPMFSPTASLKVIGSLPFYITSPIIHEIIKMKVRPEIGVLMIQKEVAQKIADDAPDASYLSVFVQTFFEVEYLEDVLRDKFDPAPSVDCSIIVLRKKNINMDLNLIEKFEGFLHKGFRNPRKMLNKTFSAEELKSSDIAATARPQAVRAEKWLEFFNKICL